MRPTFSLLPAAVLVLTLAGCTKDDTPPASSSTPPRNQDRTTTDRQPVPSPTGTAAPRVNDSRTNDSRTTGAGATGTVGTDRDTDAMNRSGAARTKDTTVKAQDGNATTGTAASHVNDSRTTGAAGTVGTDRDADAMNRSGTAKTKDATVKAQDDNATTGFNRDTTDDLRDDVDGVPASDNTARNTRDRDGARLTPLDQGSSESDIEITQTIRQAVVDRDGLSINAQNVKIITNGGVVTLRGPVATAAERTAIETIAQRTVGVHRVDNQLEIATPDQR